MNIKISIIEIILRSWNTNCCIIYTSVYSLETYIFISIYHENVLIYHEQKSM